MNSVSSWMVMMGTVRYNSTDFHPSVDSKKGNNELKAFIVLGRCILRPAQQGCHGQGKSLENEFFSRSGKSQGISILVREI